MICTKRAREISAKIIYYAFGAYHKQLLMAEIAEHSKLDALKCTDEEWEKIEEELVKVEKSAAKYFGRV